MQHERRVNSLSALTAAAPQRPELPRWVVSEGRQHITGVTVHLTSMPSFTVTPLKMPTVQAYRISLTEVEEFSNELLFEVTPISNTANARFHCSSASRSRELILKKAAAEVKLYFMRCWWYFSFICRSHACRVVTEGFVWITDSCLNPFSASSCLLSHFRKQDGEQCSNKAHLDTEPAFLFDCVSLCSSQFPPHQYLPFHLTHCLTWTGGRQRFHLNLSFWIKCWL